MFYIYGKYRNIRTYYLFKDIAKMLYVKYYYADFGLKVQFAIDVLEFAKQTKLLTVKNLLDIQRTIFTFVCKDGYGSKVCLVMKGN